MVSVREKQSRSRGEGVPGWESVVILSRLVRANLPVRVTPGEGERKSEGREGGRKTIVGKAFQAEETASSQSWRQEHAWYVHHESTKVFSCMFYCQLSSPPAHQRVPQSLRTHYATHY